MLRIRHDYEDIPSSPIQFALEKQERYFNDVVNDGDWNHIIYAEHTPVYTYTPGKLPNERLFRNGDPSSLKAPLVAVNRGGDITFHGPGQLVLYFIFNLQKNGLGIFALNEVMERSIKKLLTKYGLFGTQKPGHLPAAANGVWIQSADGILRKIASRGLTVSDGGKGITRFGCALNLTTDLSWFAPIFPCGLDIEMTSVEKETGQSPDVLDTVYVLTEIISAHFDTLHQEQQEKRHSN